MTALPRSLAMGLGYSQRSLAFLLIGVVALGASPVPAGAAELPEVTASSTADGSSPRGAMDGDRFSTDPAKSWRGKAGESSWWWQVRFPQPRTIGAILMVMGDHDLALRNAPKRYIWQASTDGRSWEDLPETAVRDERRTFRLHRLSRTRTVLALRLVIRAAGAGEFPTLREVEFYADPKAPVHFDPWAVVVTTTGEKTVPSHGCAFIPLARQCKDWHHLQAQNVWLGDFHEAFLALEPRPLCAFLSGNFIDWCQQNRSYWRGVDEVLRQGRLPMWASCGGAQGLAILAEHGTGQPWDCPHCRDPKASKTPIYGHIGHTAKKPCGDYSSCRFERGVYQVRQTAEDPVFAGLQREFPVMESHCGQIEWPPKGWVQVATAGPGTLTKMQCLRVRDRYIYAAQFHIEMDGTPATSRAIMGNFLRLAQTWGGYNPTGQPVAAPKGQR
jgi:hypothetical protein